MAITFWDRALERLTEGEPIASVCTGKDGLPSLSAWWRRCDDDPDFLDSAYTAIMAGDLIPEPGVNPAEKATRWTFAYRPEQFELVLEAIRAGRPYRLDTSPVGVPGHSSIARYRERNPDYDRRMLEALAGRRGPRRAPTPPPERFELALEAIRAGRPYCLKVTPPGVPSHRVIDRYRQLNPDYDRRMLEALAGRRHGVRRRSLPSAAVDARPVHPAASPPTIRAQVLPRLRQAPASSFELRRKLLQNELYAAVDKVVPRGLPSFIRDDVRSEMVADLLGGDIVLSEVKSAMQRYLSTHYAAHDIWRAVSFDAPLSVGGHRTLGDTLAAGVDHW
jgi:hypothetical protein